MKCMVMNQVMSRQLYLHNPHWAQHEDVEGEKRPMAITQSWIRESFMYLYQNVHLLLELYTFCLWVLGWP